MMKKNYIAPDMEVVNIRFSQYLMAGSVTGGDVFDENAGDGVPGLAPAMGSEELLGVPF